MGKMKQKFIEQQNRVREQKQDAINHLSDAYNILKGLCDECGHNVNQIIMELESEIE